MINLEIESVGFKDLAKVLLQDLEAETFSPLAKVGEKAVERTREKLKRDTSPPSAPGEPPAFRSGALHDSIGRTGPYTDHEGVAIAWGVGVGDDASAVTKKQREQGVNVFAYAIIHERGGMVAHVRLLPRPYMRPTQAELEGELEAEWRRRQ